MLLSTGLAGCAETGHHKRAYNTAKAVLCLSDDILHPLAHLWLHKEGLSGHFWWHI
jgi:hypothetical protein